LLAHNSFSALAKTPYFYWQNSLAKTCYKNDNIFLFEQVMCKGATREEDKGTEALPLAKSKLRKR